MYWNNSWPGNSWQACTIAASRGSLSRTRCSLPDFARNSNLIVVGPSNST
jgi:hypothetical protein